MTFAEAMRAVQDGAAVRRDGWGQRRAIRVMPRPWSPEGSALLLFDLAGTGTVPPFPYVMTGADVGADDWREIPE